MRQLLLTAGLLGVCGLLPAAAPPPVEPDEVGFLLLTKDHPVRIAVHLRNGDRPYQAAQRLWARRFFHWFDQDRNGSLSPGEVARLIEPRHLSMFANGLVGSASRAGSVSFASLDADKDGKVSFEEFSGPAYLGRARLGEFHFQLVERPARTADRLNAALWKLLDADGDGRLSKGEVTRLPALMEKLDKN